MAGIPALKRQRPEGLKFEVSLSNTVSPSPAWAACHSKTKQPPQQIEPLVSKMPPFRVKAEGCPSCFPGEPF